MNTSDRSNSESNDTYTYDVALSFASEDRSYVEEVAVGLRTAGLEVFYDRFVDLWGLDVYANLHKVFSEQSRHCIVFISRHYIDKEWTRHEFASAQSALLQKSHEPDYILPARFDDSTLDGLLSTTGYQDLREIEPVQLVDIVLQKVGTNDETDSRVTSAETRTTSSDNIRETNALGHRRLNTKATWTSSIWYQVLAGFAVAVTLISFGFAIANQRSDPDLPPASSMDPEASQKATHPVVEDVNAFETNSEATQVAWLEDDRVRLCLPTRQSSADYRITTLFVSLSDIEFGQVQSSFRGDLIVESASTFAGGSDFELAIIWRDDQQTLLAEEIWDLSTSEPTLEIDMTIPEDATGMVIELGSSTPEEEDRCIELSRPRFEAP